MSRSIRILSAFLICAAAVAVPLSAQNRQTVLPLESGVYPALEDLFAEAGIVMTSSAYPFSEAEIRRLLEEIDTTGLSAAGRKAYRYILSLLEQEILYREEGFSADIDARLNVETYLHTENDLDQWGGEFRWLYGHEERLPFLLIPMEAWFGPHIYAAGDLDFRKEPLRTTVDEANYSSVLTSFDALDITFPYRAFVAAGGEHWNLRFGRDTLRWGAANTGTMLISDYPDYHEFINAAGWGRNFKISALYLGLEPWLHDREVNDADDPIQSSELGTEFELAKTFFAHRLEFRFFRRIALSLSEGYLLGGKYPEFRYLNPLMIYHNLYLEQGYFQQQNWGNSVMEVELRTRPFRWTSLYGQFVLDQVQSGYEREKWDATAIPDAFGYLLGAEVSYPVGEGYLNGWVEGALASPWLYNHKHPLIMLTSRRYFISNSGSGRRLLTEKPLGYETGPDAVVIAASLGYREHGRYSAGLRYRYSVQGENSLETPYQQTVEAASLTAPSGENPERTHAVTLFGSLFPNPRISLSSELSFLSISNLNHNAGSTLQDFQWVLSASFSTERSVP